MATTTDPNADALERAFAFAEHSTKASSATFYFATRLMRPEQRRRVWSIYAWCRALDETVDGVDARDAGSSKAAVELDAIENRLRAVFGELEKTSEISQTVDRTDDLITTALAHTVRTTPGMTVAPYLDMLRGMRDDLRDDVRFEDWASLKVYCYRVAGTVGLMTLPVLGTAKGYALEDAVQPGVDLGIALQLCNIIRDVGEDARRGRLYVPLDMIERNGLTESEMLRGGATVVGSKNYKDLTEELIRLAERYFLSAKKGTKTLAPSARLPVLAAAEIYGALLQKVRDNEYDNHSRRAYTTTTEKVFALPKIIKKAWFE